MAHHESVSLETVKAILLPSTLTIWTRSWGFCGRLFVGPAARACIGYSRHPPSDSTVYVYHETSCSRASPAL